MYRKQRVHVRFTPEAQYRRASQLAHEVLAELAGVQVTPLPLHPPPAPHAPLQGQQPVHADQGHGQLTWTV